MGKWYVKKETKDGWLFSYGPVEIPPYGVSPRGRVFILFKTEFQQSVFRAILEEAGYSPVEEEPPVRAADKMKI